MSNLFVSDSDEFVIKFAVATDEKGTIYCDVSAESLKRSMEGIAEFERCEIHEYEAVFKKPCFGDTITLYDEVFNMTGPASINMNPILARYKKISILIRRWDLKGQMEAPTPEDIRRLHPVIANAIGIQIDNEVGGLLG